MSDNEMKQKLRWGNSIKSERNARGLKQEQLADAIGVSRSTVGKIEKGNTRVSFEHYLQVIDYLGLELPYKLPPSKKGIIFDVDDTLVNRIDIPPQLGKVGRELINRLEIERENKLFQLLPRETKEKFKDIREEVKETMFGEDWIRQQYGNPIPWFMDEWISMNWIALSGPNKVEEVEQAVENYFNSIEKTIMDCNLCEGVRDILDYLDNQDFRIAAMSNSNKEAIEGIFEKKGIMDYFKLENGEPVIIGGREIKKGPEVVREILDRIGTIPGRTLVVGDTAGDIEAGRGAGIPKENTILLKREYQDEIRKSNIDKLQQIENLSGLKEYIW